MNRLLVFFEKYGFLIVLLNCFTLLLPDLSPKSELMDIDLDAFTDSQSGSNLKKQLLWIIPLALYLLSLIRLKGFLSIYSKNRFLIPSAFVTFIILIFTTLFTDTSVGIKRAIFQLILSTVIFLSVYFSLKRDTFCRNINLLIIFALIICFLSVLIGNGFVSGNFVGWAKTKNSMGAYLLSLLFLFLFIKVKFNNLVPYFNTKIALLFLFLCFTFSKTSLALALIAIFFTYTRFTFPKKLFHLIAVLLLIVFLIIPFLAFLYGSEWHISLYMQPETLTGRGLIWDILYYELFDSGRLLYGYGYGSFFGTGVIPEALDDPSSFVRYLNSAHNGYLELALQLGVILSVIVLSIIIKLINVTKDSTCSLFATLVFLHNVNESSFIRDQHIIWVLLLLIISATFFIKLNGVVEKKQQKDC